MNYWEIKLVLQSFQIESFSRILKLPQAVSNKP